MGECGGLLAVGKLFDEAQIDRLFGNLERVFVVDTDFDTRVPVGISVSFVASSATAFKASCIGGAAAAIAKPSRTTAVFALFLRFTACFCAAVAKIQRHRAHSPSCSVSRQLPSSRRELEPRSLDGGFGNFLFAGIFYHLCDIKRAVCIHLDDSVCDEEVGTGASSYEDGGDACLLVEIAGAFDERGDRLFIAADDALHQVVPQHEVGSGGVLIDQESAGSRFNAFDHGCRLGGTAAGIGGGKAGGVFFVRQIPDKEGNIKGIDLYTLSNTGAFGEHGPTTVGLSGHKSIPLYGSAEAFRFSYDVVYTNVMSAGAYRGYGATQGIFALESAVNELAQTLHMDPTVLRAKNMVREGQMMPAYYGETTRSCALDRCLERAKEMIGWDEKYPCYDCGNGKVRGVGVAMAMQGSGISGVDTGAVEIKVNDDGFYSLMIGATDMGTGCDTILTQMAAECLECEMEDIVVHGVDTDNSPYDCGSYASSTTYVTGMAVVKTCETLRKKICERCSRRFLS